MAEIVGICYHGLGFGFIAWTLANWWAGRTGRRRTVRVLQAAGLTIGALALAAAATAGLLDRPPSMMGRMLWPGVVYPTAVAAFALRRRLIRQNTAAES